MCENEQKPELDTEPCYEKRELRSRSHTYETKSTGAGAGAIFMKRRAPEPELHHFYDGSAYLVWRDQKGLSNYSNCL